ncbi:hypothetical protein HHI36_003402 [Cryptolaemus montrouzieri]|uniref:G-protein coupled receptors family 1 profile domain-containing protein n=1 Tax=Cryptolaemus montrouzieri TaxID=559131 RepID=A0ABD2PDI9_9CUCU
MSVYTSMDFLYTLIIISNYLVGINTLQSLSMLIDFLTEVVNTVRIIAVLAMTIDRVLHLENVLEFRNTKHMRTKTHARLVISVTFLLAIIGNLPTLFCCEESFTGQNYSNTDPRFHYLYHWIYFTVFYLTPSILTIIFNIYLINLLRKAQKIEYIRSRTGRKKNFTLTIAATVIIVIFIIIHIPGYVIERFHYMTMFPNVFDDEKTMNIVSFVYLGIAAVNSLGNFFIYTLFCPPFKRAIVKTLRDKKGNIRSSHE